MRWVLKLMASVLLLASTATTAAATQLWQEAELGMDPNTIQGLYPEAEASNGNERGMHGTPQLVIKDYEVNNRDFNVEFFFDNDKLTKVILRLQKADLESKELPKIYEDLLESRYGEPLSYYKEGEPLPLIKATWLDGARNITLYWARIRQTDITMSIIYSTRVSREADKL